MKLSQSKLLNLLLGALTYRFHKIYFRFYRKLFLPDSSTYVGGDLKNKGRYAAFRDLFCNEKNVNSKLKSYSFLGKIFRRRKLVHFKTSNLEQLSEILLSGDERTAKAKIQSMFGSQFDSFTSLSLEEMILFEYGFLEIGLFSEAAECHTKILKKICSNPESKVIPSRLKLAASIESETLSLSPKYNDIKESSHKDLILYLQLLRNSFSEAIRPTNFEVNLVNESYYNFIYGSRVLILGPRADLNELEAGDAFDAIVVMNYHGPVPQRDEIIVSAFSKAKTTLIAYFANDVSQLLSSNIKNVYWEFEPDFIVTKSNQFSFQQMLLTRENSRTINAVDELLVLGSGNFLQHCLYDVLCFSPKSVKIIGIDFWVGGNSYSEGYKIHKSGEKFPKYSFAGHNVFSNWLFPKALRIAGMLECSEAVGSVLDLELNEYAERLCARYPFG